MLNLCRSSIRLTGNGNARRYSAGEGPNGFGEGGIARNEPARHAELYMRPLSYSKLTASIGVSEFGRDGDTLGTILRAADERLYRAKNAGRNCVISA